MNYPRNSVRYLRHGVQIAFLLFTLFIGWKFHQFVLHFEQPGHPFVPRPASVESFLPIGGFMALKFFIFTGIVDPVHPAGFFIFTAALVTSLLLRRGFCGWICPVGTASQYAWMAGEKIFGKNFRIERMTDAFLRSLKYILLSFFVFLIGIAMAPTMVLLFFLSDYYKIVDVRMLKFFTEMSTLAFVIVLVLVLLSVLYKNFWCRYLCPYGALLGILSRFGPVAVRRDEEKCVHCGACTKHCPTLIDVEKAEIVKSAECFGCLTCVSRCPAEGALDVQASARSKKKRVPAFVYPALVIFLFYLIIGIGMALGKWQSAVPYEEYQRLIPKVSAEYRGR